jgi:uncharacterized DUF497 family protein
MPFLIAELDFSHHAVRMLTLRGIAPAEVRQLPSHTHMTLPQRLSTAGRQRHMLIGRTDGGRPLTVVIEETSDSASWIVITGWQSSIRERKLVWR